MVDVEMDDTDEVTDGETDREEESDLNVERGRDDEVNLDADDATDS